MKTLKTLYLPLLALFAMLISTACGCIENKLPITKEELIGKTKEEVLQIAFEKSPIAYGYTEGIRVGIQLKNGGGGGNFHFNNIEEAKANAKFYSHNSWEICYKKAPFRIDGLRNFWVVYFEKGKAVRVELGGYSEF